MKWRNREIRETILEFNKVKRKDQEVITKRYQKGQIIIPKEKMEYCPNGHQNNLMLDGLEVDINGYPVDHKLHDGNVVKTLVRKSKVCPKKGCEYSEKSK